jgi:hypothetical protein
MERDVIQSEEEGSVTLLEESESGAAGRIDGRSSKLYKLYKLQLIVPFKAVVTVEEIRLKRLKKGYDISRSRLICEAIELLEERETGTKSAGKAEEAATR